MRAVLGAGIIISSVRRANRVVSRVEDRQRAEAIESEREREFNCLSNLPGARKECHVKEGGKCQSFRVLCTYRTRTQMHTTVTHDNVNAFNILQC